ncbi:MAG TPA: serine/threonine-protein phosphatase [Candidatus Onthocola gallistercoris]|uniref:Serine/threonine-protein phosphatase n=1 Tax=Candidatus Onthocola gallistercoris TaxID=2840876 RepID=A0A9D1HEC0_9FIRM|nr:serine/threonine-protein phosphatase [Candidatus Onthocola gallistercoris]
MFRKRKTDSSAENGLWDPTVVSPVSPGYPQLGPGLYVTSVSLIGGRKNQQDVLDYRPLQGGGLAAVLCDGMGGLSGGALAARTACSGFFQECGSWDTAPDLPGLARKLDRRVSQLRGEDGLPLDGGSTLTAVMVRDSCFHWLSVGDSRIGLFRDGQIFWLNRLHNYQLELDEALYSGELSQAEYEAELPRGHALLSYLGCGYLKYIDFKTDQTLAPSDILLLCSDGFYDLLPETTLPAVLAALDKTLTNLPDLLAPYLGQTTRRMDNASAVIMRYR